MNGSHAIAPAMSCCNSKAPTKTDHPYRDVTPGVHATPGRFSPPPKAPSHSLPWRARAQRQAASRDRSKHAGQRSCTLNCQAPHASRLVRPPSSLRCPCSACCPASTSLCWRSRLLGPALTRPDRRRGHSLSSKRPDPRPNPARFDPVHLPAPTTPLARPRARHQNVPKLGASGR
jgi:hypothetical protein